MNSSRFLLISFFSILVSSTTFAQQPQPTPLDNFRAAYKAAIADAIKPLREQYLKDLDVLKNQAIGADDLKMLGVIDREIGALKSEVAAAEKPVGPSTVELEKAAKAALLGSAWTWETRTKKPSIVRFNEDGKFKHDYFQGTYTLGFHPTTVKMTYGTYTAQISFDEKMTAFVGMEKSPLGSSQIKGSKQK